MTRRLLMTADAVGGVWQYSVELARGLARSGMMVDLALLGPPPAPAQRAAADVPGVTLIETGLPLDWLSPDARTVIATADALAQLARARGADIVQVNQPALADAAYPAPVAVVIHSCVATWWDAVEHGPPPAAFAWQTDLVARGLACADIVVAPTNAFAEAVRRVYRLPRTPMVVHNGRTLPAATGAQTPPAASAVIGMHDLAFTAGRLWDRGKNVATLDRAAARLGIPFKAAGATAGPNGDRVLLEHLHAMGQVGDAVIAGVLSARPIFASAALYEPFGLAVLEAALSGCALVLSDIPTFRELWGGAATFVPARSGDGFADAIAALAADAMFRTASGERARRRALGYAPDRTTRAMAALFDRLPAHGGKVAA